jgi:hypothetical protein
MTNRTNPPIEIAQKDTHFNSSSVSSVKASDYRLIFVFLGAFVLLYILLTFNGYGNHDDIYRMIGTWRSLLSEHRYVPSRFQGYLVPELSVGLASQLGDFYLSNLVSVFLGISSLFLFYRLLLKIIPPQTAALATATVGANSYWIIAATTSTDYIYPAFFFIFGLWLLLNERMRWAGLVFSLAVSSRITYGPMIAIALACYFPIIRHHRNLQKRFFQGILLFIAGCIALYLPIFLASGMTFSFLTYAPDHSGMMGAIARFLYKNIYLWGLPAVAILLIVLFQERQFYWQKICKTPFRNPTPERLVFHAVLWCFIYNELLFVKLPHQYQYLIPVLFCIAYFLAILPPVKKQLICFSLIIAFQAIHAVINFDIVETYQTGDDNRTIHSDGGYIQPGIKPGILVRDYQWRSQYQHRLTEEFNQRWQHFGKPLHSPK